MSGTTTATTFPTGCSVARPRQRVRRATHRVRRADDSMFELLAPIVDGDNSADRDVGQRHRQHVRRRPAAIPEIWNADGNTPLGGSLRGAKRLLAGPRRRPTARRRSGRRPSAGFCPIVTIRRTTVFLPNRRGRATCNPNPPTGAMRRRPAPAQLLLPRSAAVHHDPADRRRRDVRRRSRHDRARRRCSPPTSAPARPRSATAIETKAIGFGMRARRRADREHRARAAARPTSPASTRATTRRTRPASSSRSRRSSRARSSTETCNNLDDDCDTRRRGLPEQGRRLRQRPARRVQAHRHARVQRRRHRRRVQRAGVTPGHRDVCNGLDDDCDGQIDEGIDGLQCNPTAEICDGKDQDCDGMTDEGVHAAGVRDHELVRHVPGHADVRATHETAPATAATARASARRRPPRPATARTTTATACATASTPACSNVLHARRARRATTPATPSHNPIPAEHLPPGSEELSRACGATATTFGACSARRSGCNPSRTARSTATSATASTTTATTRSTRTSSAPTARRTAASARPSA